MANNPKTKILQITLFDILINQAEYVKKQTCMTLLYATDLPAQLHQKLAL